MTLQELYAQIGGNYEEALTRLQNDQLVGMFVAKYPSDTTCRDLFDAWDRGDEAAAFEAAHAAKGVSMNLAITSVSDLAVPITEALRPGNEDLRAQTDVGALVAQLRDVHARVVAAITAYEAS